MEFFARARQLFPGVHLRLYTSGYLLTRPLAQQLRQAGLDEIRFSVKQEDAPAQQDGLQNLEMAVELIPDVLVEMPVFPGGQDQMRQLLLRLDKAGAKGINLLELCFPYNKRRSLDVGPAAALAAVPDPVQLLVCRGAAGGRQRAGVPAAAGVCSTAGSAAGGTLLQPGK